MWRERVYRFIGGFFCALFLFMQLQTEAVAGEEPDLYAMSAVLVDADTGRVLYGKNADTPMAMASTTKIMTCILVLENADLDDELKVSSYATTMPKVKLYLQSGESYRVRDLLYSLMLESHNDSAVALAEHVGKKYLSEELQQKDTAKYSVEESKQAVAAFAFLMNAKARELGCENTYFITPNGLDATESITLNNGNVVQKEHCTTAKELACIMAYCIEKSPKSQEFLEITATPSYTFSANGRSYSCNNHNAFLNMMQGAISGKTGFTNKAGYCYVGALESEGRTFVVSLLACGWPNNKSYKWSDTRELMEYGMEHYAYREFSPDVANSPIPVVNGAAKDGSPYHQVLVQTEKPGVKLPVRMLVSEGEEIVAEAACKESLCAPVAKGTQVGTVTYYLMNKEGEKQYLWEEAVYTSENVKKIDFEFVAEFVLKSYFEIF